MAELELAALPDRLGDDEIAEMASALENVGAPQLPRSSEASPTIIADGIDPDVMAEFLDRLEAYDIACDIYLPVEFEGRVEVGEMKVGSAQALGELLDEMKDDLETADEEEGGDEDAGDMLRTQLRHLWKIFHVGAQNAVDHKLPLHVRL